MGVLAGLDFLLSTALLIMCGDEVNGLECHCNCRVSMGTPEIQRLSKEISGTMK
jgi:hypothetical protein